MRKEYDWLNERLKAVSKSFIALNTIGWGLIYGFNLLVRMPYLYILDDYIGLTSYYVFGYLVSFVLRLFLKKIDIENNSLLKLGTIVLVVSFIYGVLWYVSDLAFSIFLFGIHRYARVFSFPNYIIGTFLPSLILLAWSSTYFIVKLWQKWEAERIRLQEASVLLQESELKLLRYQVNPHFLFNSLNSIRALTLKDPKLVREMVTELSEFLKYSLLNKNHKEAPLEEEMKSLGHYIKIERYRFDDNLKVEYFVDHFAEEYPVPVMILHPLVENAVKYGMRTSKMPLVINISAVVKDDNLHVEIRNSGTWYNNGDDKLQKNDSTNTGLENAKNRLINTYGNNCKFEIEKADNEVAVKIQIKKKPEGVNE